MNAAAQGVIPGSTANAGLFPWRCYSNGMKSSQDFKSLAEAGEHLDIPVETLENAVKYKEGIMGGFIFVNQH